MLGDNHSNGGGKKLYTWQRGNVYSVNFIRRQPRNWLRFPLYACICYIYSTYILKKKKDWVLKWGCCYGMREGNCSVHLIVDTMLASSCPSLGTLHPLQILLYASLSLTLLSFLRRGSTGFSFCDLGECLRTKTCLLLRLEPKAGVFFSCKEEETSI